MYKINRKGSLLDYPMNLEATIFIIILMIIFGGIFLIHSGYFNKGSVQNFEISAVEFNGQEESLLLNFLNSQVDSKEYITVINLIQKSIDLDPESVKPKVDVIESRNSFRTEQESVLENYPESDDSKEKVDYFIKVKEQADKFFKEVGLKEKDYMLKIGDVFISGYERDSEFGYGDYEIKFDISNLDGSVTPIVLSVRYRS